MVSKLLHDNFKAMAETVMPVLSSTQFKEKGVLTPEEFVAAGDLLVYKCPTWSWEAGDPKCAKPYLPRDKQFLITRNVPCEKRVRSLEEAAQADDEQEMDDDWMGTHMNMETVNRDDAPEMEMEIPSTEQSSKVLDLSSLAQAVEEPAADDDDSIPDMDAFEDNSLVQDEGGTLTTAGYISREEPDDPILKTRKYDLSITYDKYYQTPRVWLFGYDEKHQPLQPAQTFEDMSQDHARKTVTIDPHPHYVNLPHASVHPCQHAKVMKKICDQLRDNGLDPRVDQYLFIFLKFISAVIPTMQYDFTFEMDMK